MLSNKVYDVLKWVCLICLPASIVAIRALGGIFGLTWAETVAECGEVAEVFLGSLLGISCATYKA